MLTNERCQELWEQHGKYSSWVSLAWAVLRYDNPEHFDITEEAFLAGLHSFDLSLTLHEGILAGLMLERLLLESI